MFGRPHLKVEKRQEIFYSYIGSLKLEDKKGDPISKIISMKKSGGMAQVVEHLL
jgi:hypothetical protein